MKLLWVKAGGLLPADVGGRIRSYQILRQLAKRHEVTVFTFYAAEPNDLHGQLEKEFSRVVSIPLDIPERGSARDLLMFARQVFTSRPYSVAKYCRAEVRQQLQALLAGENFDAIVCDFVLPAEIVPTHLACPMIIFTHNVEALIWKRHYEVARNPIWKAISYREYRAMAAYERRHLQRADHVLAVSDMDASFFRKFLPARKIDVVPTGVDIDYFYPAAGPEEPDSLVFTGSMDWLPNEDAMFYFVREVLPLLRREFPSVSLTIVGRQPSTRLRSLAREHDGVEVTGRVDDVRPYVHKASVYVVPLRVGSGTRLKIFEAMAMGKAIVSTTLGAEGLPVAHDGNLLLADTPADFAEKVARLLRSPADRNRLGQAARELVEKRFSWQTVSMKLEEIVLHVRGARDLSRESGQQAATF